MKTGKILSLLLTVALLSGLNSGGSAGPPVMASSAYLSWGADRMNIPAYAEFLANGNIRASGRITVAVLDTTVLFSHPIFDGKRSSIIRPCADAPQGHRHGTEVAGIIADLTRGLPVDILPMSTAHWSGMGAIADAIRWAADNGVNVINLSFEQARNHSLCSAINYAIDRGMVVVAAAGNSGGNLDTMGDSCNNGHVSGPSIFVSAVNSSDANVGNSNFGTGVSLAGAGHNVGAASHNNMPQPSPTTTNAAGMTSIAAPHIAAAAALLLLNRPDLTPAQVQSALVSVASFRPPHTGLAPRFGAGVPDMALLIEGDSRPNYGDVDGSGYINSADVTMLRRYIAHMAAGGTTAQFEAANPGFNVNNADVNGNGTIDFADVTLLRRYVAATDPATVRLGPP
jgi:hypothetical protein